MSSPKRISLPGKQSISPFKRISLPGRDRCRPGSEFRLTGSNRCRRLSEIRFRQANFRLNEASDVVSRGRAGLPVAPFASAVSAFGTPFRHRGCVASADYLVHTQDVPSGSRNHAAFSPGSAGNHSGQREPHSHRLAESAGRLWRRRAGAALCRGAASCGYWRALSRSRAAIRSRCFTPRPMRRRSSFSGLGKCAHFPEPAA
jgi:hypothetical protein